MVLLLIVLGRATQLEATWGDAFREEALRPAEKQIAVPAARGRILARDGAVLAYDQTVQAVAVHYRWLQDPPDEQWLRSMLRSRLPKADRKDGDKVWAERAKVVAERAALTERLAALCGLSPEQWAARSRRIQARVQRIAETANQRRQSQAVEAARSDDSWLVRVRRLLLEEPPPPRIIVAEELDYHMMADGVPASVADEIERHGERYPGTKVVSLSRRTYPAGPLAAHILGHLGRINEDELAERNSPQPSASESAPSRQAAYSPDDWIGRMGIERRYEAVLHGRHGVAVQQTDRSGRVVAAFQRREPTPGGDVTLCLDRRLQQTAEELLDSAMQRRMIACPATAPAGGAIVVMDVHDGAIRAAASAPAFDPNLFVADRPEERAALLSDKSHPLFDRVSEMAIPPGSTFKVLTAIALLESAAVDAEEPFVCQGYLEHPDRQRCEIFVRQGVGHGEVALADALAVSCNVYFFHFAGRMGPQPLVDWAGRFGFGRPTGVNLPGEASGVLPSPENIPRLEGHAWRTADTQALAIGQGSLTATPLQVLRMMAAVANGGRPVTPHLLDEQTGQTRLLPLASRKTLEAIREGLRRTVADPQGTAHGTVLIDSLPVAGKTGTAETGGDRPAHAWFAGYAPAEDPKLALVVVLEHAGDGAAAAGPVARRLVARMEQLGLL